MKITLQDLINLLEDEKEKHGPDAEVQIMADPKWPINHSLDGVVDGKTLNESINGDTLMKDSTVFLVQGDTVNYGHRNAWSLCRDC